MLLTYKVSSIFWVKPELLSISSNVKNLLWWGNTGEEGNIASRAAFCLNTCWGTINFCSTLALNGELSGQSGNIAFLPAWSQSWSQKLIWMLINAVGRGCIISPSPLLYGTLSSAGTWPKQMHFTSNAASNHINCGLLLQSNIKNKNDPTHYRKYTLNLFRCSLQNLRRFGFSGTFG